MLEFLYEEYGTFSSQRKVKPQRYFHIDPAVLERQYEKNRLNSHLEGALPYSFTNCNNLLEYACFVVHKGFGYQLKVDECMGLMVEKGKHLKNIILKGVVFKANTSQKSPNESNQRFKTVDSVYE